MGWWSSDIMGGDSPLDIQAEIYDLVGKEQFPEGSNEEVKLTAEDFNSHPELFDKMKDMQKIWGCDEEIIMQVFAYLLMKAGGTMSDEVRAETTQACDNDYWAYGNEADGEEGDDERREHIEKLKAHIESYRNEPANLEEDKGLFSKLAEHMNPGLNIDFEVMKADMEKELKELKSDGRLSYPDASVMINAPLALIQVDLKARIHTLEKHLKLPSSKFPLERIKQEG